MSAGRPLRVGLLGAGTVGREVVRSFLEHPERLTTADGPVIQLAGVAVRDIQRARRPGVALDLLTDAPAHLVADPRVDVIVELMGGDEPARTLIAAALAAGKSVVTANKHVLAHHGPQLEALARRSGAALRFEAAVGGGIPVLAALVEGLPANRVSRVRAILNGTTNFMLSRMASEQRDYGEVLADAQAAGYAEADPTADVEGIDAANKLVILIRLAFGFWPEPGDIPRIPPTARGSGRPGITGVTRDELAAAGALGLALKLIADARRLDDGRVSAAVQPTAVPLADPMGRILGVTNRIEIRADPVGNLAFSGPGAGGPATGSAVLADLLAIARGSGSTWPALAPATGVTSDLAGPVTEGSDRGWFAFLPAVRGISLAQDRATTAEMPRGAAIHARCMSLHEFRAAIAAALPGGPDVTIYPADEASSGEPAYSGSSDPVLAR